MNIFSGPTAEKFNAYYVGIRPEHITVSMTEGTWKGRVGVAEHLGSDTFIHVHDTGLQDVITVRIHGDISVKNGDAIFLTPQIEQVHKFDAKGLRIE